jgi:hypothetical protein
VKSELDEVDRAVREHLSDPDTLMLPHLLFLAWGRKPVDAAIRPLTPVTIIQVAHKLRAVKRLAGALPAPARETWPARRGW